MDDFDNLMSEQGIESNDDFDFGTTSDSDDMFSGIGDTSGGQSAPASNTSKKKLFDSKKLTLLALFLVGVVIVIIVTSVYQGDSEESTSKSETTTSQTSTQPTTSTTTVSKSDTDWIELDDDFDLETVSDNEGTLTITEVKLLGRKTTGTLAPIELQVEVAGALSGYDGIFKTILPYKALKAVKPGITLNITYKTGKSGDKTIIYDVEYK